MAEGKVAAKSRADMDCVRCELAVYCYTVPGTWVFRTKAEMTEKKAAMEECPVNRARKAQDSSP